MADCKTLTSESTCENQVGCFWKTPAEMSAWLSSISTAVTDLKVSTPTVPADIGMRNTNLISAHDHLSVSSSQVESVIDAWETKYNMPSDAMTALKALVAVESADFKHTHVTLKNDVNKLYEIAAGGRNQNGQVALAFVFASATTLVCDNGYGPSVEPWNHSPKGSQQ